MLFEAVGGAANLPRGRGTECSPRRSREEGGRAHGAARWTRRAHWRGLVEDQGGRLRRAQGSLTWRGNVNRAERAPTNVATRLRRGLLPATSASGSSRLVMSFLDIAFDTPPTAHDRRRDECAVSVLGSHPRAANISREPLSQAASRTRRASGSSQARHCYTLRDLTFSVAAPAARPPAPRPPLRPSQSSPGPSRAGTLPAP